MEAFGIAAGVLQVAGFGAEVGSTLWRCAKKLHNASKELESIAGQVETTSLSLKRVDELLKDPATKALHTPKLYEDTNTVSQGCHEVFRELDKSVKAYETKSTPGKMRLLSRTKWLFDSGRLAELGQVLRRYNDVLHLMVSVMTIVEGRRAATKDELQALEANLRVLTLSNKDLSDTNKTLAETIAAISRAPNSPVLSPAMPATPSAQTLGTSTIPQNMMFSTFESASLSNASDQTTPSGATSNHLQRCMDSVQELAKTIACAMDKWHGHGLLDCLDVHGSYAKVSANLEQLPAGVECMRCMRRAYKSTFHSSPSRVGLSIKCTCDLDPEPAKRRRTSGTPHNVQAPGRQLSIPQFSQRHRPNAPPFGAYRGFSHTDPFEKWYAASTADAHSPTYPEPYTWRTDREAHATSKQKDLTAERESLEQWRNQSASSQIVFGSIGTSRELDSTEHIDGTPRKDDETPISAAFTSPLLEQTTYDGQLQQRQQQQQQQQQQPARLERRMRSRSLDDTPDLREIKHHEAWRREGARIKSDFEIKRQEDGKQAMRDRRHGQQPSEPWASASSYREDFTNWTDPFDVMAESELDFWVNGSAPFVTNESPDFLPSSDATLSSPQQWREPSNGPTYGSREQDWSSSFSTSRGDYAPAASPYNGFVTNESTGTISDNLLADMAIPFRLSQPSEPWATTALQSITWGNIQQPMFPMQQQSFGNAAPYQFNDHMGNYAFETPMGNVPNMYNGLTNLTPPDPYQGQPQHDCYQPLPGPAIHRPQQLVMLPTNSSQPQLQPSSTRADLVQSTRLRFPDHPELTVGQDEMRCDSEIPSTTSDAKALPAKETILSDEDMPDSPSLACKPISPLISEDVGGFKRLATGEPPATVVDPVVADEAPKPEQKPKKRLSLLAWMTDANSLQREQRQQQPGTISHPQTQTQTSCGDAGLQHHDEAEAYQAIERGDTQPATLTAESVKRVSKTGQRDRRTATHTGTTFSRVSNSTNTTLQIRQTTQRPDHVTTKGQFGQPNDGPEMFPSYGHDSFPAYGQFQPTDHMSPPEISVDYSPPVKDNHLNRPPRSIADGETLSPPIRHQSRNRMRAKSDSYAGSRPITPLQAGRGRSPSLHPPTLTLAPFDNKSVSSRSSSPARARNGSLSPRNGPDQRDYILDLADPARTPSDGAESRRQQKHPATFQCTLCPKRFTRAYNLRSHLRTHTDERPFVCTACGEAFARQHEYKRHERLHSSATCVTGGESFGPGVGVPPLSNSIEDSQSTDPVQNYNQHPQNHQDASSESRDPSGLCAVQSHGVTIPSNGQSYRPGMPHAYSARQAIPTIPSYDSTTPSTEQPSQPVPSARSRSDISGAFGPISDTSSSCESSDSEEGSYRRVRHSRQRGENTVQTRRALEANQVMPPPPLQQQPQKQRRKHKRPHLEDSQSTEADSTTPSEDARPHQRPRLGSVNNPSTDAMTENTTGGSDAVNEDDFGSEDDNRSYAHLGDGDEVKDDASAIQALLNRWLNSSASALLLKDGGPVT